MFERHISDDVDNTLDGTDHVVKTQGQGTFHSQKTLSAAASMCGRGIP